MCRCHPLTGAVSHIVLLSYLYVSLSSLGSLSFFVLYQSCLVAPTVCCHFKSLVSLSPISGVFVCCHCQRLGNATVLCCLPSISGVFVCCHCQRLGNATVLCCLPSISGVFVCCHCQRLGNATVLCCLPSISGVFVCCHCQRLGNATVLCCLPSISFCLFIYDIYNFVLISLLLHSAL